MWMTSNPVSPRPVTSARDLLVVALESAGHCVRDVVAGISESELHWEPISNLEREADLFQPANRKRVWRVFQSGGVWVYDYTPEPLHPPPFTTLAWIMNHIAQTAEMYLYCIRNGISEGVDRSWDDLPVYPDYTCLCDYIHRGLQDTHAYLDAIPATRVDVVLNSLSPAPWGELRPVYLNLWGGIISHTIEHASQIATLKDRIRYGY
jgi:hypothetical protein